MINPQFMLVSNKNLNMDINDEANVPAKDEHWVQVRGIVGGVSILRWTCCMYSSVQRQSGIILWVPIVVVTG